MLFVDHYDDDNAYLYVDHYGDGYIWLETWNFHELNDARKKLNELINHKGWKKILPYKKYKKAFKHWRIFIEIETSLIDKNGKSISIEEPEIIDVFEMGEDG